MNKKVCPYCHTETYYMGAAGEREAEEPQEYLYFKVDDQNGEFADRLKIDYCPKCGRRLLSENATN